MNFLLALLVLIPLAILVSILWPSREEIDSHNSTLYVPISVRSEVIRERVQARREAIKNEAISDDGNSEENVRRVGIRLISEYYEWRDTIE